MRQPQAATSLSLSLSLFPTYLLSISLIHSLIVNFSIISVKAKSFADREIRYTLKAQGQGAGTFNIGPSSGIVKLAKELDFEDLRQPHVYSLIVTATEDSGGFSTSVEVSLHIYNICVCKSDCNVSPFLSFTAHHTRDGCQR